MSKQKMVSDIFQAYKGQDMTITFYGLPADDTSRLGVVSVGDNNALVIHHVGNEWDNGITRNECPLQAAREFLAIEPKVRVERLERINEELIEEFDYHTERRQTFDGAEGAELIQRDLDGVYLRMSRIEELIAISNAQHALSVEFNVNKRTQIQQDKTQSLTSWIVANSHSQSIESRSSLQKQLEKETTRLYSAKRSQKLKEDGEALLPKVKASQTDAQVRLASALGISFGPSDNLGDMINDEIAGYDALQSIFDNLVSYTNADVQTRSSKIEMIPDRCPFCGITNGQYALFTFNENGSYCFSCKESANIVNTALAIRNHAYDSTSHDDGTSGMTEEESRKAKEEKEKTQVGARGKKSVWLGSYHKYNMRIFDITNHDYRQVVNYFVNNKGLNEAFVTVHLLNYLDKHHIRYNYCNYSYKTGQRGIALNVPYVAARQRVRAIKRRLIDETLQQDAKRWNFNIYPKATHESHLWTTHDGESEVVVVVENQLDAAILNLISEMRGTINMISFCAPLVPKNIDIALGASRYKDSSTIVLAYDLDETGDHYVKRDFERLKSCNFRVMSYVWEGLETESLLDTMTRTKFSLKALHDEILSYIG